MVDRPLEGRTIGITADRRWREQADLLERRGASVVHGPTISTVFLDSDSDEGLRRATQAVIETPPDYLLATTGIGMRAWLDAASGWGLRERLLEAVAASRVAARGPKAAAAVEATGLAVWARSASEQMGDLVSLLLAEPLAGRTVAFQEYGTKTPEVTAAFEGAGARVLEVPVYRWRAPEDPEPALRLVEAARRGEVDAITFTSAPAVHNLFALAGGVGAGEDLRDAFNDDRVVCACVGPVCASGALEEGVTAPLVPPVGRLGLLVRALSDHFSGLSGLSGLSGRGR